MSRSPYVSIVTPVYNGATFLEECIASVLAQTHGDFEFVILDNASTDETGEVVLRNAQKDRRIRYHRNEETLPIIENWNRALELISEGSVYCRVLHADDTMHPRCLEKSISVGKRHPSAGIIGCLRQRGDQIQCKGLPPDQEIFQGAEIARLFLRQKVFALAPTSNLVRADLVRARRPFYPREYLHADLAAYFELLDSCDFGFVHEVLAFSRVHEGSITATVAERNQTILKEWLLMLQRYGPRYFPPLELAAVERSFLHRYYRNLIRAFVTGRGRSFFEYHLAGLGEARRRPGPVDLLLAVGAEVATSIAHPHKLVQHLRTARKHAR